MDTGEKKILSRGNITISLRVIQTESKVQTGHFDLMPDSCGEIMIHTAWAMPL